VANNYPIEDGVRRYTDKLHTIKKTFISSSDNSLILKGDTTPLANIPYRDLSDSIAMELAADNAYQHNKERFTYTEPSPLKIFLNNKWINLETEYGLTYTQFFAFYKTKGGDLDNLRDSDCCSSLLKNYNLSNPPDGWFRRYWENGNLRYEWYFKDGKQDGVSKSWWPNGDIKNKQNYKNGKLHGPLKGRYEDGQLSGIRDFKNGKRDGLWTDYYKSGQKWYEGTYNNGKEISSKYWNRDGSIGKKACHKQGELKQFRKINPDYK